MPGSSIGEMFRVTTFGESHGPALGCIIDGCPPGMPLCEADLQGDLDRRRPGTSKYATQRQESDQVKILSGVFEGVTTGTSIGLLIENEDQKSKDYSAIKDLFGPRMQITPTNRSTASATIGAAAGHRLGRRRCGLRLARLQRNILW